MAPASMRTEQPEVGQTLFLFADPETRAKTTRWRRTMDFIKNKFSCQHDDPELRRKVRDHTPYSVLPR